MKVDFERLEHLLAGAVAHNDPAERAAFLQNACGQNSDLHREVQRLLAIHHQIGSFLEEPAVVETQSFPNDYAGDLFGATGLRIGRYNLLEPIGGGAFGVVYLAEQLEPVQRRVALKIIKPGMETREVVARFEAERQALALMDHPGIAHIFDGGVTQQGRPYFVMELVPGLSITEFCDEQNLSTANRLHLFIKVCDAVQHAHQKGVIHRDLKPSNILVATLNGRPVPKVIDFGIAKALSQKLTEKTLHTGCLKMVGTPAYMSPEQANFSGLDIDTRSDIFSLGVLLYELLTGRTPLDISLLTPGGLEEALRRIREEEPAKPSTRLNKLPREQLTTTARRHRTEPPRLIGLLRGDLDWIVMKCLEKDRARRYETVSALVSDIRRHLESEPIAARPPSKVYRFRKLVRRNKLMFGAGALTAASLVTGLTLATILFFREQAARKQADEQAAIAQAVNDFLQNDLLRQADSRVQAGSHFTADPGLTVREALERASQRIGTRFKEQPTAELAIRSAIGDALLGTGHVTAALPHLERALELCQSNHGANHPETLNCMDRLAAACSAAGHPNRAQTLLETTLRKRIALYGPQNPETVATMNSLGWVYQAAGRLRDAMNLSQQALAWRMSHLGPDHPATLDSMANLAISCQFSGDPDRALPLLQEVLRLRRATLGPDHPDTSNSLNNLAAAYHDAGRLDQALPLYEQAFSNRMARLGPDHPDTLSSKHNLGCAYTDCGMLEQALSLLEEILRIRRLTLAPGHYSTLLTMNALAGAYQEAGRLDDAINLFEEAKQLSRTKMGPDHLITIRLTGNQACAHLEAGCLREALELHQEAAKLALAGLGADHPHTLRSLSNLGRACEAAGQPERALPILETTFNREWTRLGPKNPFSLETMNHLGLAYLNADRLDEASALLEEALRLSQNHLGPDHRATRKCMINLALAYQLSGKVSEAAALLEHALRSGRTKFVPEHPETLRAMAQLGECRLQQGRALEAEALARECLASREKIAQHQWQTHAVQLTLGTALLHQARYPEAERLLLQACEGFAQSEPGPPAVLRTHRQQARQRLAELYHACGRPDEAVRWRQQVEH